MKRCSMCGEIYDDRVDFCFDDGTPLEAIVEESAAATSAPSPGIDLSGLDAPDPENISGLDAPDPIGVDWGNKPSEKAPEAVPEAPPVPAATIPEAPSPEAAVHTMETEVPSESGQMPAGFNEPPSQFEVGESAAEEDFWDGGDDDLDFPDDFGTGEGTFGQDYTDPTIPAPRQSDGGGAKKMVAGFMVAVVALLAFALSRGGDSVEESSVDGIETAQVEKPVREIETRATPAAAVAEPVDEEPSEEDVDQELEEELEEPVEEVVEEPEPEPTPEPVQVTPPREAAPVRPVVPAQPAPAPVEEPAPEAQPSTTNAVDPWATAQPEAAPSRVRVFSKPSGASLYVDGRAFGSTPAELDLDEGQHSIRVEKDGYFAESRTVSISGPTHLERFELRAESQRVTVNCYGPDASKVYLDGKVICAIPGSGTVTTGEHTFRVVTPDRFYRKVINVQRKPDGSPTPLRFTE